jgi:membrane protease subunit HflC
MSAPRNLIVAGIVLFGLLIVLSSALFTVNENEQAILLQFGAVQRIDRTAGLKFKVPFVQNVVFYEKRLLDLATPPEEVILSDQARLVVDAFVVYRIEDPLKFYQAVRTDEGARQRLTSAMNATLRDVLGGTTIVSMLSKDRESIMQAIRDKVNDAASPMGIAVVDVRISRANLPESISQAIYGRMKSEREREAAEYRAQGFEQAQEIKSKADRERTAILADAKRQADILHGQGEGEAIQVYADAFGKDPEFYAFYRSLEAYRKSLTSEDSEFILSPNSDFLKYLNRQSVPAGPSGKP